MTTSLFKHCRAVRFHAEASSPRRRDLISSADTILTMANTCNAVVDNISSIQVYVNRGLPAAIKCVILSVARAMLFSFIL